MVILDINFFNKNTISLCIRRTNMLYGCVIPQANRLWLHLITMRTQYHLYVRGVNQLYDCVIPQANRLRMHPTTRANWLYSCVHFMRLTGYGCALPYHQTQNFKHQNHHMIPHPSHKTPLFITQNSITNAQYVNPPIARQISLKSN